MNYEKPWIVHLDAAAKAIQGQTKGCINAEQSQLVTPNAYEADE